MLTIRLHGTHWKGTIHYHNYVKLWERVFGVICTLTENVILKKKRESVSDVH